MGRRPVLPTVLLDRPFTLTDARRAGIERAHLRGASWKRVGPGTYAWSRLDDDPIHELEAARFRLPDCAAFSGFTAAWLHGLDVAPCRPVEATVPDDAGLSARAGLHLRRAILDKRDVVTIRTMRATSMARTIGDLAARLSLTEAVVIADAALHLRRVRMDELNAWVRSHHGRRGIRQLRRVIDHVEPAAESPMESRLRMLLVRAGLPRPRAQVSIHDDHGQFAGRLDLYYEVQRLGIEYDCEIHRESLTTDNRRQNMLVKAGVQLLRFTGADVLGNPDGVVMQVRRMLSA